MWISSWNINSWTLFKYSVAPGKIYGYHYFPHFLLFRSFKNVFTSHLRSVYMNQRWQILSSRIDSVDLSRTTSAAKYSGPPLIYRSLQIRTRRFHIKPSRAYETYKDFFGRLPPFIHRALIKYNGTETANLHSDPIVCGAII